MVDISVRMVRTMIAELTGGVLVLRPLRFHSGGSGGWPASNGRVVGRLVAGWVVAVQGRLSVRTKLRWASFALCQESISWASSDFISLLTRKLPLGQGVETDLSAKS
jgi:hypothetical protein